MTLNPQAVRVIVYDLDGTVYDDNRHFELYAREIQKNIRPELQDAYWQDYEATLAGRHPALRIGCLYDWERDLVLRMKAGRVAAALHWDGTEVPAAKRDDWYPGPVEADHRHIINVGDLWWVPSAISGHYKGDPASNQQSFLRIREVMADPGFIIQPIPGFKELVESLRTRVVQVLATNSPQPDSEAILQKVGLLGRFDGVYFQTGKPAGLRKVLEELTAAHHVAMEQILSIGDNLVNEIAPAMALGCQTIFIDPHGLGEPGDADLVAPSMRALMPQLKAIFLA